MLFTCSRCRGNSSVWKSDHRTGHVQHRLWVYCATGSCHQVAATEIDSTEVLSGRASVNQKSDQVYEVMSCFETEINYFELTYSGNYLLNLDICTFWEIRSLQVNLLCACNWWVNEAVLREKTSDRNAQDCVSKLRIYYLVTWQRTLQGRIFCPQFIGIINVLMIVICINRKVHCKLYISVGSPMRVLHV
jgi:hypothetical protein